MDKEIKEFIESQNKALVEDIAGVIHGMGMMMESRMDKLDAKVDAVREELKADIENVHTALIGEIQSVKQTVERIDDRTQRQVDAVFGDIHITKDDVEEVKTEVTHIKAHIGMPA